MSQELKKIKKDKFHRPEIVENDAWLEPVERDIIIRHEYFKMLQNCLERYYGSLYDLAGAYDYFGLHYDPKRKGWFYREWAPNAHALFIFGEFNNWNRFEFPLSRIERGVWEVFIDEKTHKIEHGSLFKVLVEASNGRLERIPSYVRRVVQDDYTKDFTAQYWAPKKPFDWEGDKFKAKTNEGLFIYECHVGMAQEKEGLGTYREFADEILPRIQKAGYNAIQMMAVQEHPYYGSFGYHVSSFFAPSSRFGTPEDLKYLVKKAHKLGIAVIMDIVHSHAVQNIHEGLNQFDGTDGYFLPGVHPDWDSKLFDYGKWEVLQFLLSNVRYWLEEFHFDGFRYDGVSSMLYWHFGHENFDHQYKYFRHNINREAIAYLQLANYLAKAINPNAILIAEDVSGMPGIANPIQEGGIGFDYRLGMGIPDFWIKLLKESHDEAWDMGHLWNVLNDRHPNTKTIAYAESHDQALVGDKTLAFWLMDKHMYYDMHRAHENIHIDRGIALHKMIRLITLGLGGQAYLNFMGNEFGHPEWIDFPREGNNWSYTYARRQWSLRDNETLRYSYLADFDEAMITLFRKHQLLEWDFARQLHVDQHNQTLIFERKDFVFVFNFSPHNSIPDYRFKLSAPGKYQVVLNSDDAAFGGFGRLRTEVFFSLHNPQDNADYLSIYNVNRTAIVLQRIENSKD